jgi:voltage-gated potassium channel
MPSSTQAGGSQPYQVFMLSLCLYALAALATESFLSLDPSTREVLQYADNGVCVLFFLDFLVSLFRAPKKWRYLYTWGWIDLASSIPTVDALRWGRAARIARIFRVLRGVRATKLLASFILDRRSQGAFLAAALVSILLVIFSSIAILQFETEGDSNIKSAEDALWWAIVTITTVGYGDKYPLTAEGRIIAGLLMTAGVGMLGTFSGFVAAWFLAPQAKQQDTELEGLRQEISEIRELLETRRNEK